MTVRANFFSGFGYIVVAVMLCSMFIGVQHASAENLFYVSSTDNYSSASSWKSVSHTGSCDDGGDGAPTTGDTLIFTNACSTNLTIDNGTTVGDIVAISSYPGTITQGGTLVLTGKLGIDSSATIFNSAGFALSVGGDWENTGTYISGSNTVTFNGSSTQAIITGGTSTGQDFWNLVISNTSDIVELDTNAIYINGNFTIEEDAAFELIGNDITVAGTFSNEGEFDLFGVETVSLTMDTDSGVVIYFDDNGLTFSAPLAAGNNYYSVVFADDSNGSTWTMNAPLVVSGDFYLTDTATLITGGDDLTIAGNWTKQSGTTFTHGNNEVTLNGTGGQILSGDTTFYNLAAEAIVARTITLTAGDTFTISNLLSFDGGAGGQNIQLVTSSVASTADLNVTSVSTVTYLTVRDISNSGATITCSLGCADLGNNTGWIFASTSSGGASQEVSILTTANLSSPNGGETLAAGEVVNVTWIASGSTLDSIRLSYTTNGRDYTEIASGLENDGSYLWTVPNIDSGNVKIRVATVSSAGSDIITDHSNSGFTIVASDELPEVVEEEQEEQLPSTVAARMTDVTGEVIDIKEGSLFRGVELSGVYLVKDGTRYVFPSTSVFDSYGYSFDDVVLVQDDQLRKLRIGGRIVMNSGTLIKIRSNSKVYEVGANGALTHIQDEATAISRFGNAWAKLVHDISETFWFDYTR